MATKTKKIDGTLSLVAIGLVIAIQCSCGSPPKPQQPSDKPTTMLRAEQIKIADLRSVLTRLRNKELEYDFFGLTSNGVDCIYFVPDGSNYAIEFEMMTEAQKPWLAKLKEYAQAKGYDVTMTTYNNHPQYSSSEPAPVLRIETRSDLGRTATIGHDILAQVFGNNDETVYDVVP